MRAFIRQHCRYLLFWPRRLNRRGARPGLVAAPAAGARQFLKERKAIAAVEFGMIGAPLLLMIVEIFQSGLYVYDSASLNHATQAAARQVMTGGVQNGGLTAAQFRTNLLCPLLPTTMPCGNVIVNLQTVSEAAYPGGFYNFVNGAQTAVIIPPLDNSKTSFCPGGSGKYVYLQVYYAMPLLGTVWLPFANTTFQGQTVVLVSAAAAFKNEPYQSNYPGC
ncbi:MAG: TadE/TadG family type IV pilus assembly protein [Methylocella sp.]